MANRPKPVVTRQSQSPISCPRSSRRVDRERKKTISCLFRMSLVGTQKNRDRWGEFGLIQPTHPCTHARAATNNGWQRFPRYSPSADRPAHVATLPGACGLRCLGKPPLPLTALTFATVAVNVPQTAQRTNSPTNTQSPAAGRSRCPAAVPLASTYLSIATARHLAG